MPADQKGKTMSKITREIADNALIVFAGQTVTQTEVGEYIGQQYTLMSPRRAQTFGSFAKTMHMIEAAVEYVPTFSSAIEPRLIFPALA